MKKEVEVAKKDWLRALLVLLVDVANQVFGG
jgi:hypothetical protein